MKDLKYMSMDLCASLWYSPCSHDNLFERKVIKSISEYGFNTILNIAKKRGWIYERNGVLYCYKNTVIKILNPNGYEIELICDSRSEFRKSFDKLNKL